MKRPPVDEDEASPASTAEVQALPRSWRHKLMETEFGKNWRSIRWWTRQFTPVSTSILGVVLAAAGTWIVTLAHKVDNQGTKLVVLETQVLPVLKESKLESDNALQIANLDKRVGRIEGVLDLDYAEQMKAWAEAVRAARARGLPPPPPPRPKR